MAFMFPRISRATAEKVFIIVRNSDSNALHSGDAAFWYMSVTDGAFGTYDGYSVTHGITVAANQYNAAHCAGVVAESTVYQNEYGQVQVYGRHDAVKISNNNTAPFSGALLTVTDNAISLFTNYVLRPLAGFGVVTGATNHGYFAPMALASTITTQAALDVRPYWPGGVCMPIENLAATLTYTSTGTIKAFVNFL
jgi:hypothetical protein